MEQSNNIQPTNNGLAVIKEVFSGCTGLTSITLPQGVSIAEHANSASITILESVTITIPESVNQQNGPSGGASEDANESGSFNPVG